MALVSPPKPWQRSQPDTIQPSPSSSSSPATTSATGSSQQPPGQAMASASGLSSQPSCFGYGQSSMGYSLSPSYMSSSYSGSGYGSPYHAGSIYGGGGGYGSGSYSVSPYGSGSYSSAYSPMYSQWGMRPYNSMPFPGQLDAYKGTPVSSLVNSGHAFMSGVQQHVSTFGRFSQILHMNLDALQMSFSSILQLLTNASMLRHELSAFFGTFGSIRAIYLLYVKLRHLILRLIGRSSQAWKLEFEGLWQDSGRGRWGWMPTFLTLSLALLIVRRLVQFVHSRPSARIRPDPLDPAQFWPASPFDQGMQWPSSSSAWAVAAQGGGYPPPNPPPGFDPSYSQPGPNNAVVMPDF